MEFGMYIQCTNSTGTKYALGLSDTELPVTRSFVQPPNFGNSLGNIDGSATAARSCVCTAGLVGRRAWAR
jgi:hypothetical protein